MAATVTVIDNMLISKKKCRFCLTVPQLAILISFQFIHVMSNECVKMNLTFENMAVLY